MFRRPKKSVLDAATHSNRRRREHFPRGGNNCVVIRARRVIESSRMTHRACARLISWPFQSPFPQPARGAQRLVEGRGDNLALNRPLHVGDFFRPLVDQQNHQHNFRVIRRNRVRTFGNSMVLPARGGETISPAVPCKRREQVHDARADILAHGLQLQTLLRYAASSCRTGSWFARLVVATRN